MTIERRTAQTTRSQPSPLSALALFYIILLCGSQPSEERGIDTK